MFHLHPSRLRGLVRPSILFVAPLAVRGGSEEEWTDGVPNVDIEVESGAGGGGDGLLGCGCGRVGEVRMGWR